MRTSLYIFGALGISLLLTGGSYFNATNTEELVSIYQNLNPELIIEPEPMEITSLFAGASVLLLLAGAAMSLLWFSRFP